MRINILSVPVLLAALTLGGCSGAVETAKVIWGSSTQALERSRPDAVKETLRCPVNQCYAAILDVVERQKKIEQALAQKAKPDTPTAAAANSSYSATNQPVIQKSENIDLAPLRELHVFLKDPKRNLIVLMGVPGSIDTTEVGIFLTTAGDGATLIEIASLSKLAKAKVAEILLPELKKTCPVVAPPPAPTASPTAAPTAAPTVAPTAATTVAPTAAPTAAPTTAPTQP